MSMLNRYRVIHQDRRHGNDEGFTLIEIMIVVAVLGILAAVAVFSLGNVTSRGSVSACKADAKSVEVAVEVYRTQTGVYPPTSIALDLVSTYLRTSPSSTHYAISIKPGTGEVDVQSLTPAIPAASFDNASNPCDAVI